MPDMCQSKPPPGVSDDKLKNHGLRVIDLIPGWLLIDNSLNRWI